MRHHFLRTHKHTIVKTIGVLVVALVIAIALLVTFTRPIDAHTIVRGVSIAGIKVGGLAKPAATETLRSAVDGHTLTYTLNGKTVTVDADAGTPAITTFDMENAIDSALAFGRTGGPLPAAIARVRALGWGGDVALPFTMDRPLLRAEIERQTADIATIAKNARFSITLAGNEPRVTVVPETEGKVIDFDALMTDSHDRLQTLSSEPVIIMLRTDVPEVRATDATTLTEAAALAVSRAPLTLDAGKERWTLSRATVAEWVTPLMENGVARVGVDRTKATTYLAARATSVTVEPKDAEFEEKDGKVTRFVPAVNGETLDIEDAIDRIQQALVGAEATKTVELTIIPKEPEITTEKSNPYGIKELIGVGGSNFAGSPKNRRHNIATGARAVDGTIVPVDGEFSMMQTLGAIDGSTGYLQELVIKGNKTIPEYGGGLCQIGSTAFRAALDSGLLITERRNHSYRVGYYEKDAEGKYIGPGKDATIYDPAPDFKFKNDTGHPILITTEIVKDSLRFYFWGVRDGRVASQTDSRVYNVVQPPPKKLIETDDLAPGMEKCTESPHPGANAVFTYTVTHANGETKEVDFVSHYRPWQEVCLIGRDPNKPLEPVVVDPGTISADASGATGEPTP